jgi:DNA-binding GntR family transcriptional regulator
MSTVESAVVSKNGPRLLSKQVADVLRERIVSGLWPPNFRLSSEPDLAVEFEVSRGTVRVAVQSLVEEGLLIRVHGRGTFVTAGSEELLLARLESLSEMFMDLKKPFDVQVLKRGIVAGTPRIRRLLRMTRSEDMFQLRRRFVVESEPHALVENRLALATCPEITSVDFTSRTLFGSLKAFGKTVAWGRRTFEAVIDESVATELLIKPSAPLLHIEQISYDSASCPIEHSDIWARSDRLRVTTVLRR